MLNTKKRKFLLLPGMVTLTIILVLVSTLPNNSIKDRFTEYQFSIIDHTNITMTTDTSKPVIVIILAYMHTGSTFTGSVLQQHPGTYYQFEALRNLQSSSRKQKFVQYLNGTIRHLSGEWVRADVAGEAVDNMINCRLNNLDIGTLQQTFLTVNNPRARDQAPFMKCINQHKKGKETPRRSTIKSCLPYLITPCEQANVRAFKFIRLPMASVRRLLSDNPNLRVIHLVRDPRAMLDSQVRKGEMGSRKMSTFIENTKRLCNKMHVDYETSRTLPDFLREKVIRLRYEDLTESPVLTIEKLFNVLGLRFLHQDRQFVDETARKGYDTSGRYRLDAWRRHISSDHLAVLNKNCKPVYNDFGYIEYNNVSYIRNIQKSTYLDIALTGN